MQAFRSPTSRDNGNGLMSSSQGGGDDKGQTEQWVEDMEEVGGRPGLGCQLALSWRRAGAC